MNIKILIPLHCEKHLSLFVCCRHDWPFERKLPASKITIWRYKPKLKALGTNLSRNMRFPTMWYVRPATAQISLRKAHSDQCLSYSLDYSMSVELLAEHYLEFLSVKGGCTGLSDSTLVKMSHWWKARVATQIKIFYNFILWGQIKRIPVLRVTRPLIFWCNLEFFYVMSGKSSWAEPVLSQE